MGERILAAILLALAVASHAALADDNMGSGDKARRDQNATANAVDKHCDDAVSLFYLGNPAASGGFYNNPWADCKAPANSR
jgi:hypothetical protein